VKTILKDEVVSLFDDYFIFNMAYSQKRYNNCDRTLYQKFECCDYHKQAAEKIAELRKRMEDIDNKAGVTKRHNLFGVGSQTWWERLAEDVGIPIPPIAALNFLISDVGTLLYGSFKSKDFLTNPGEIDTPEGFARAFVKTRSLQETLTLCHYAFTDELYEKVLTSLRE